MPSKNARPGEQFRSGKGGGVSLTYGVVYGLV